MLIAAHGNSLRALVKYLDNMSDADIMALNIPTGLHVLIVLCTSLHIIYAAVVPALKQKCVIKGPNKIHMNGGNPKAPPHRQFHGIIHTLICVLDGHVRLDMSVGLLLHVLLR